MLDEFGFLGRDLGGSGAEPSSCLVDPVPVKGELGWSALFLPGPHGAPKLLLPAAEVAVLIHPALQSRPALHQCLVGEFGRVQSRRAPGHDDQPGTGQSVDQRPVVLGELSAVGNPAGVRAALPGVQPLGGADQLNEYPLQCCVLGSVRPLPQTALRVADECPLDTAELLVGGGSEEAALLSRPQLAQGVLQHGQRGRTPRGVVQQLLDQTIGEADACVPLQRAGDGLAQLLSRHRRHDDVGRLPGGSQDGQLLDLGQEVDPGDDHRLGRPTAVGPAHGQDAHHGVQLEGGLRSVRKQGFELVDHEQKPGPPLVPDQRLLERRPQSVLVPHLTSQGGPALVPVGLPRVRIARRCQRPGQ